MRKIMFWILALSSVSVSANEQMPLNSNLGLEEIRQMFREAREPRPINYYYARYKCRTLQANIDHPVLGNEEDNLQFKGTQKYPILLQPGSTGSRELILTLNGNELIGSGRYENATDVYYLAFRETSKGGVGPTVTGISQYSQIPFWHYFVKEIYKCPAGTISLLFRVLRN